MSKIKLICQLGLIASMLGLCIVSLIEHQYKTFALGALYSIANTIIFIV